MRQATGAAGADGGDGAERYGPGRTVDRAQRQEIGDRRGTDRT
jgi:hypothetical protein